MLTLGNALVDTLCLIIAIWVIIEVAIMLVKRLNKAKKDLDKELFGKDDNNGKDDTSPGNHS